MAPRSTGARAKKTVAAKKKAPAAKTARKPVDPSEIIAKLKAENKDLKDKLKEAKAATEAIREAEMAERLLIRERFEAFQLEQNRNDQEVINNLVVARNSLAEEKKAHAKIKKEFVVSEKKRIQVVAENKVLKAGQNSAKQLKMMNDEKKKLADCRKEKLAAQKELRKAQETGEGAVKPWRHCEICLEQYTETPKHCPRVLDCGHTLCSNCIKTMIDGEGLLCPFDRQVTLAKKTNLSALPKNYTVLHM